MTVAAPTRDANQPSTPSTLDADHAWLLTLPISCFPHDLPPVLAALARLVAEPEQLTRYDVRLLKLSVVTAVRVSLDRHETGWKRYWRSRQVTR